MSPLYSIANITVTTDVIDRLELSGSGNIVSNDTFEASELELRLSGSANISVRHITTGSTLAILDGSGNFLLL